MAPFPCLDFRALNAAGPAVGTVGAVTLISRPVMPGSALAAARRAPVLPSDVDLAVSVLDLTELTPTASPRSTASLVARAVAPGEGCPPVAAVCVHSQLVPAARAVLPEGSSVRLACVAGGFPLGKAPVEVRWAEVRQAVADGADEVDIVVDRASVAEGDFDAVAHYVAGCVDIVEDAGARLKVIIESGELGSAEAVWVTSNVVLEAGGHFLKTSTGFSSRGATLEDAALLMMAVRDFAEAHGVERGVKISGGVGSLGDAVSYLELARQLGLVPSPEVFRFGASGLLGVLVAARRGEVVVSSSGY